MTLISESLFWISASVLIRGRSWNWWPLRSLPVLTFEESMLLDFEGSFRNIFTNGNIIGKTIQYHLLGAAQGGQHTLGYISSERFVKMPVTGLYRNSLYMHRECQPIWDSRQSNLNPYSQWAQTDRSTKHHQGCKRHMVSAAKENKPQRATGLNLPAASSQIPCFHSMVFQHCLAWLLGSIFGF